VEAELAVPAVYASFVGGCAGLQGIVRGAFPDSACAAEGAELAEARNERPVALAAYERARRAGQEFACRRAYALTATRW